MLMNFGYGKPQNRRGSDIEKVVLIRACCELKASSAETKDPTKKGAIVGVIYGFAFNMGIGVLLNFPFYPMKEKDYVHGCPERYFNATGMEFNRPIGVQYFQSTASPSCNMHMLIRVLVVVSVGTLASFITPVDEMDAAVFADAVKKHQKKPAYPLENVAMLSSPLDEKTENLKKDDFEKF